MTQREALTKILTENQSDDTFRASENAVAAAVDVLLAHGVIAAEAALEGGGEV